MTLFAELVGAIVHVQGWRLHHLDSLYPRQSDILEVPFISRLIWLGLAQALLI